MAANQRQSSYHYDRPGVVMITLNAREGVRLAEITPRDYRLTELGALVKDHLLSIPKFYPQIRVHPNELVIMPEHIHAVVHVLEPLFSSNGRKRTVGEVIGGFKGGLHKASGVHVFDSGLNDVIILDRNHLERSVRYIGENIDHRRKKMAHRDLFRKALPLKWQGARLGTKLWRFGNGFLLDSPLISRIQVSRRATAADIARFKNAALREIDHGAVFVSPFISPGEKELLDFVIENGASVIHVVDSEMGPRYRPFGRYFDLCDEGRLLEISVFEEFPYADRRRITRQICLRMNDLSKWISNHRDLSSL